MRANEVKSARPRPSATADVASLVTVRSFYPNERGSHWRALDGQMTKSNSQVWMVSLATLLVGRRVHHGELGRSVRGSSPDREQWR